MKKLLLAIATVAMVFATSCKKENTNAPEEPAGDNEFVCVIDQSVNSQNAPAIEDGMGTMAHVDDNNIVWWQAGDNIAYYGQEVIDGVAQAAAYHTLTCSKMATDGRAYFSATGKHFGQGDHVAYYPSTLVDADDNNKLKLPSSINIDADKNAAFLPMYGTGTGQHYITFTNICAVLKITLPEACDQIVLSADQAICGEFSISNGNTAVVADGGGTSITVTGTFVADQVIYVAIPAKSGDSENPAYSNVTIALSESGAEFYRTPARSLQNIQVNKVYPVNINIPTLLPGVFSVSSTKKVQFTRGNLYYNGTNLHLETLQSNFTTSWNPNHVDLFYFEETAAEASGARAIYKQTDPASAPGFLFCEESHKIRVDGTSDMYALSSDEWKYLVGSDIDPTFTTRPHAASLRELCVIGGYSYLLIAPDNHDYANKPLNGYSSVQAATEDGMVCLPAVFERKDTGASEGTGYDQEQANYISSTRCYLESNYNKPGYHSLMMATEGQETIIMVYENGLVIGNYIRLVKTYTDPQP